MEPGSLKGVHLVGHGRSRRAPAACRNIVEAGDLSVVVDDRYDGTLFGLRSPDGNS